MWVLKKKALNEKISLRQWRRRKHDKEFLVCWEEEEEVRIEKPKQEKEKKIKQEEEWKEMWKGLIENMIKNKAHNLMMEWKSLSASSLKFFFPFTTEILANILV